MSEPTDETDEKDAPKGEPEKSEKAEKAAPLDDAIAKAFADDVDPEKKDDDANGSAKYGEEADISAKKADDDDADEEDRDDDEKDEKDEKKKSDLFLPKGNPFRTKRGLIAILAGGVPAFLLMAKNGQNAWAFPIGLLFIAVAAFGVMDL